MNNPVERPPLIHAHVDLEHILCQIKEAYIHAQDHAKKGAQHYALMGELFKKAKETVGHGGWETWVEKNAPFGIDRVRKCIRLANQSMGIGLDEQWRIITGHDKEEEEQPAKSTGIQTAPSPPPPQAGGGLFSPPPTRRPSPPAKADEVGTPEADPDAPEEQPASDEPDYLSFWARWSKPLAKKLKQMNNALVMNRDAMAAGRKAFQCLQALIEQSKDAPVRPPEADKCRKCGAAVLWATTVNHSRVPLDAKPGGGKYELIDGVAHYCEWDTEAAKHRYRNHHARCVPKSEPIPE